MSVHNHHTFLGKLLGKPFDALVNAVKSIGGGAVDHTLLAIAIAITQGIKIIVTNPLADIAVSLTSTQVDNLLLETLRTKIPLLIADELAIKNINPDMTQEEAQALVKTFADTFGGLSDDKKEEFFTSVGANVLKVAAQINAGQKITFGVGAMLVEQAWEEYKKLKQPSA